MKSLKKILKGSVALSLALAMTISSSTAEGYFDSQSLNITNGSQSINIDNGYGADSSNSVGGGFYGSSADSRGGFFGGGNSGGYNAPPLQGRVVYAPAGTPVPVRIQSTLSSEFSRVGETFTAALDAPIYAGGEMVAPPGSTLQGQVVSVIPAGRGGKAGALDLRLTSIVTPDGKRYPLSASVDRARFQLSASGGRAGHFVKSTAVGAGGGALAGLIGSAISGGKKGKASAIGTGIGGGIGLLGGAVKKGQEFVIQSGFSIPFLLDSPLQVNVAPRRNAPSPGRDFAAPSQYGGGGFQDPGGYNYR